MPPVDILVAGTSCKDMSRANSGAAAKSPSLVLTQATSRGGSADTFQGFLQYVESHRPFFIFFENVDAMMDESSKSSGAGGAGSNMDVFLAELSSRGYEAQAVIVDANEFGLPCRRRRCHVFLIRAIANPLVDFADRSVDAVFTTFRGLLSACICQAPCASKVRLDSKDLAVKAELEARQAARASARGESVPNSCAWVDAHMQFAEHNRLRWGQPAPEDLQRNAWFGLLTHREQDALVLNRAALPSACYMFRDVSQSVTRVSTLSKKDDRPDRHVGPTMMPRQCLWMEDERKEEGCRIMLGREALLFQGFPAIQFLESIGPEENDWRELTERAEEEVSGKSSKKKSARRADFRNWPSESLMSDLAGNAMALPVMLAMVQCAFASISWKEDVQQTPAATQQAGSLINSGLGLGFRVV